MTVVGAVMVSVPGFVVPVRPPVQLANWYPVFGLAVRGMELPETCHEPVVAPVMVPDPDGLTARVN